MRFLFIGVAFMLTMLTLMTVNRAAQADAASHVFQISCLPEINLFEIRDIGYVAEANGLVSTTSYDFAGSGYALYAPDWSYYQRGKPSDQTENESGVLFATRFNCKLRTATIALVVLPIPAKKPFSPSVNDISITLGISNHWIVEQVPFALCEDRGPITRLFYDGGEGIVGLEGRFGGVWPDKITSDELTANTRRRYKFNGSTLSVWDSVSQALQPFPGPLTANDIDYFQNPSSESYGEPVTDCV